MLVLCLTIAGCSGADDDVDAGDTGTDADADVGTDGDFDSDGDFDGDGGFDADFDVERADADGFDAEADTQGDADTDQGLPECRAPLDRPLRLFFIGNSFTLGGPIPDLVQQLATAAGWPPPHVEFSAYGGYSLERHRDTSTSVDGVDAGSWDFVVLQEYSTRPTDNMGDPAQFKDDATWFYDRARAASPDSTVLLYETWARHPDHEFYPGRFADAAEMQAQLRTHYNDAADRYIPEHSTTGMSTDVDVAPAGDVWEYHLGSGATPNRLHADDDYHAGTAGQYVNALVLYSTIYGCRAVGLSALSLSSTDAAHLQESADAITGEIGVPPIERIPTLRTGETIRIDFGEVLTSEHGWNVLSTANGSLGSLVTVENERRRVGVAVTDGFEGANESGLEANELGWPGSVSVDVLWTGSFAGHEAAYASPAELTIHGLEPGAIHWLELFASRAGDDSGAGRLTRYIVGSEWRDLEVASNTNQVAVFDELRSSADGDLVVRVEVSPAGASRFAYIGALILSRP